MRKLIFSILLASAAASPALAQDQDHGRWHHDEAQGDRAQAREERSQVREQAREERSSRPDTARVEQQVQVQQQPQPEARRQQWQSGNTGGQQQTEVRQQWQGRGNFDGRRNTGQAQVQSQPVQVDGRWDRNDRGTWNRGDLRQGERVTPNVMRDRNPVIVNDPRWQGQRTDGNRWQGQRTDGNRWAQSGQQWSGSRYSGNWNRDWRNDRRYDWRRYRDSHRSIFHIGIYYDPFGYGYRPFDIGYQLYPSYFSQQYWIDPAQYGLPYPPPGTQWVRYWNDALLVDMYTGQVVDVVRGFFW
jgi:Ni/Co efflux regulator RcnB